MTGTAVVQPVPPESVSAAPGDRPAAVPVSGATFLLLLAQLLQGTPSPVPVPLTQKIGGPPDGLEGEAGHSPESSRTAEGEPSPLTALAMVLPLPLKMLPPVTGTAASVAPQPQDAEQQSVGLAPTAVIGSSAGATSAAVRLIGKQGPPAAAGPVTPTPETAGSLPTAEPASPTAVPLTEPSLGAPGLDGLRAAAPAAPAPARPQEVTPPPPATAAIPSTAPAPASPAPRVEKPAGAAIPSAMGTVREVAPGAARVDDTDPPVPVTRDGQATPAVRPEVTLTVGAGSRGEFRNSLDRDGAGDEDRGRREPAASIGGELAGPTPSARPAAVAAPEESQRPGPAAAPRPVVEQVAERIGLLHREGRHEVSLRLEPPELGVVRIQAVLEGQHLTLQIRTELEQARVALEQALPQLRESLAQQGIVAGRVTVQLDLDASARQFHGQGFAGFQRQAPEDPAPRPGGRAQQPARWGELDPQGVDLWV